MNKNPPVIPQIASQHTEEAAFLWLLRDNAVTEAHYDLNHLSDLENRLEAHLDGLRVAGETGWHMALENLQQFPESGEMFAAATLAFESSGIEKLQTLYDIAEAHPETERGLISALGWVEQKHLSDKVNGLLESQNPFWRRMGIAACAIHRVNPGKHLTDALQDDNPALCCCALKAVGELGLSDQSSMLEQYFTSDDPDKRFWSAWAATLTGNRDTAPVILQSFLTEPGKRSFQAAQLLFRILPLENSQYLLGNLAQQPEYLRLTIQGSGITGDSRYLPWLIQHMETPELARVAGEAFSLITGVDLAWEDLETDQPEGFEAGPTESAEDENVALDPDENLPWPHPGLIQPWWQQHQAEFPVGQRYLMGKPVSEAQCYEVLKTGMQRQRIAAAFELALMRDDGVLFATHSKAAQQKKVVDSVVP